MRPSFVRVRAYHTNRITLIPNDDSLLIDIDLVLHESLLVLRLCVLMEHSNRPLDYEIYFIWHGSSLQESHAWLDDFQLEIAKETVFLLFGSFLDEFLGKFTLNGSVIPETDL